MVQYVFVCFYFFRNYVSNIEYRCSVYCVLYAMWHLIWHPIMSDVSRAIDDGSHT